ncbi:response regulator [Polaribacter litorisediminis]|uniref:response regulator n=1 Tax=Polaribacter litorisediminis TaxID=1908341 RepID=UPI001CBCFB58|nr:response regulator [Polaribacter litorisediminis]UAM97523.1 response regulator [Polaribacter litorisediminis]
MKRNSNKNKGISILVLEDNPGDYILIEDFLLETFNGVKIHKNQDFKSTLEFLREKKHVDLILLDLNLPDMSGLELIKNMTKNFPQIPIIILTGYSDLELAKRSLELGVHDYLIKDEINPSLLHKSIEFAISRNNYVGQIENQNEKLKHIAWTQSHIVRAPLARILGVIDMIETLNENNKDLKFWLEQLKTSSIEMDDIVKNIIKEAQTLNLNKVNND